MLWRYSLIGKLIYNDTSTRIQKETVAEHFKSFFQYFFFLVCFFPSETITLRWNRKAFYLICLCFSLFPKQKCVSHWPRILSNKESSVLPDISLSQPRASRQRCRQGWVWCYLHEFCVTILSLNLFYCLFTSNSVEKMREALPIRWLGWENLTHSPWPISKYQKSFRAKYWVHLLLRALLVHPAKLSISFFFFNSNNAKWILKLMFEIRNFMESSAGLVRVDVLTMNNDQCHACKYLSHVGIQSPHWIEFVTLCCFGSLVAFPFTISCTFCPGAFATPAPTLANTFVCAYHGKKL